MSDHREVMGNGVNTLELEGIQVQKKKKSLNERL